MENFDFCSPTRIIFGENSLSEVGKIINEYGYSNILIHYGSERIKKNGILDEVISLIEKEHINYFLLGGVVPNPRVDLIRKGIDIVRSNKIDFILAIGGGSVIDYDKDVYDLYLDNSLAPKKALPLGSILTIPAAGSESSTGSVVSNDEGNFKLALNLEILRPIFTIMNPVYFTTLPKIEMANGVCDMLCHIMERYFSKTHDVDFTKELSEALMRVIIKNGLLLARDMKNISAWSEIGISGTFAHNNLLGIGKSQDWTSHKLEHEVSALYNIAHGTGLAIIFPRWMNYIISEDQDLLFEFAVKVFGVEYPKNHILNEREKKEIKLKGIEKLLVFFKDLGLPSSLSDLGIHPDEETITTMASKATGKAYNSEFRLGSLKQLDYLDCINIYKKCL
ncbi:MAG: iron-containing alcohol dehydrogenase [Acholeplasmatales bacterium]|jgi:alcohol dehydrogenase YqhD (iron-dependent ADH family)|nr:iron-containing alcohol dehydrogenase [Acholeplasmatales bacterium]